MSILPYLYEELEVGGRRENKICQVIRHDVVRVLQCSYYDNAFPIHSMRAAGKLCVMFVCTPRPSSIIHSGLIFRWG